MPRTKKKILTKAPFKKGDKFQINEEGLSELYGVSRHTWYTIKTINRGKKHVGFIDDHGATNVAYWSEIVVKPTITRNLPEWF